MQDLAGVGTKTYGELSSRPPFAPSATPRQNANLGSNYRQPTRTPVASTLQSRVGQVTPQRAIDPAAAAAEQSVRRVLKKMLQEPNGSQLRGTPMSLASVVSTAASREEQARHIEAYWTLTAAVADYYLGVVEAEELQNLSKRLSTYSTAINEAKSQSEVRKSTALTAARVAQQRLSRMIGGAVPLPSDIPFTGPYATRLGTAFPGGVPSEARLIHDLLPLRLAELQESAKAVTRSQNWAKRVMDQGGSDETGIVRALELNALNRRAFVMLARDYNLQISRYTQLFAPQRIDTSRLVAMLIRTSPAGLQTADDTLVAGFATGSTGSTNSASRDFAPGRPSRR